MRSTFAGYYQAYSGIQVSQLALDVTGQNITNMHTENYTRQRLEQIAIGPPGPAQFMVPKEVRAGQGVKATEIKQIRDEFLDARYRSQLAKTGTNDARNEALDLLGSVFDNVDDNMIAEALDDVWKQMQSLSSKVKAGEASNDESVRASMQVLVNYIHQAASEMNQIRSDLEFKLEDSVVPDVNATLESIRKLNVSIRNAEIMGNSPAELKDQRHALLDDLGTYFNMDVFYGEQSIGSGFSVETIKITFEDADGKVHTLIDDDKAASFAIKKPDGKVSGLQMVETDGSITNLDDDNLPEGVLKGDFQMLNKKGSIDGSGINGFGYYQALLDSFANKLAVGLNNLNKKYAAGPDVDYVGELFVASDGTDKINAMNLQINPEWVEGKVRLIASKDMAEGIENSTANELLLEMQKFLSTEELQFTYTDEEGVDHLLYEGNMPGAYANIQATYGIDSKSTQADLDNQTAVTNSIYDARDSISGVNLDEEVMNLMKYSKAYAASSKLMAIMDQVLEQLINNVI